VLDQYLLLTDDQTRKLDLLYKLHMSATINLTSIKNREDFYLKHYLDSIKIFKMQTFLFDCLVDVGSGGGFPGLVVAIFYPESMVYLVESKKKKCFFLRNAVSKLKLENVLVVNKRVEDIRGIKADIITARGVCSVKDILRFSKNVSRETTKWILYKGTQIDNEINDAKRVLDKNNLRIMNVRVEEPFKRTYCIICR